MYLLYKLKSFWKEKWYKIENLHILTCNHQTRIETSEEIQKVISFAHPHPYTVSTYYWTNKSENHLRTWRHNEFINACLANQSIYLLLWHHLDDRIETSILNIMRGCGIEGIQSMKEVDKHYLNESIHIFRPLISWSKAEIENECKKNNIPYSIDKSNYDVSTSKRNRIRYELFHNKDSNNIRTSLKRLYKFLDNWKNNDKKAAKTEIGILHYTKAWERNEEKLYDIYRTYQITINPRSNTLSSLSSKLQKPGSKISYQWLIIRSYSYGSVIEKIW